ncbi:phage tail spike protein [Microbacterium sp. NPDC091662]|uniref:phage tail spike protein n=1 Tax=Microbacterium sp. NPDC091662 TaxID=3364211 RepID=UPI003818089A
MGWDSRLAWSGEVPLSWPGLGPVALQRFTERNGTEFADAVEPSRVWKAINIDFAGASSGDHTEGRWGKEVGFNRVDPAAEKGRVTLPYFDGLWPSSGKLLIGLWLQHRYTMAFTPFLSTRGGSSPLVYLSGYSAGNLRHQVYNAGGATVGDLGIGTPWGITYGYQWVGQLVDFDARTSTLISVNRDTGESWISPALALSGPPAVASKADLDVFSLQTAGYWSGGYVDEVLVAHPSASFNLRGFVDALAGGTWARGEDESVANVFSVTDTAVTANTSGTLQTGAERVSWTERPDPSIRNAVPYWSTDNGKTWLTGAQLPARLTGLLRWEIPLTSGSTFTGLELLPPAPTIAPIDNQSVEQRGTLTVPLTASWAGLARWTVTAAGVAGEVSGTTLTLRPGWASGDIPVTVTLRDDWDRIATRSFMLNVYPQPWEPAEAPQYPRTPIVIGDGDEAEAVIDSLSASVVKELNGEHLLEFSLPLRHPKASLVVNEQPVELAGELYRIRRVTTERKGRAPALAVYCEAKFYDLAYAGQVPAREYLQAAAGTAIEDALVGTGWTLGAVNVTTRRTYSVEEMTPLAMLRLIQSQHGGDLLFDGRAQTVSLVAQSGRDNGVAFMYGRSLSGSKRVVDTTSLVTRIIPRNADGVGIESVNGGVAWVEDFTYTDEVRSAVYNFAEGASPFTMLAMASATLANRSKPSYSYEFTVADLSHSSGQPVDAFDVGDVVTVVDQELGIRESQRVLKVEHDVARPWASKITLSGKLRELGSSSAAQDAALSTGSTSSTFDLVPYNLLKNARFDNLLAHWASSGATVVDGRGTGDYAVRFAGSGTRWIEQTVQPDNRDVYSLSLDVTSSEAGVVPTLRAIATVYYEDGSSESIPVELA